MVAARYTSNNGQAVTLDTAVKYEDLGYDTHNAYDVATGIYTVAVSGVYSIKAIFAPIAAASYRLIGIHKNGVSVASKYHDTASANEDGYIDISTDIDLVKGDEIEIIAENLTITLDASSKYNHLSIHRIK